MIRTILTISTLLLSPYFLSYGDDLIQAKYGPEFSFSNDELVKAMKNDTDYNNPKNISTLREWKEKFEELCRIDNCIIEKTRDKHGEAYKVLFKDGFWFQAGVDTGCLEVQTKPATVAEFTARKDLLHKYIWQTGEEMGLKPHKRIGGGHINMDLKTAFPKNNALLFRNFIVDQANHPELIAGIFGNHTGNAPPISALEPHLHDIFEDVIKVFDETMDYRGGLAAMEHLGKEVQGRVYVSNPFWLENNKRVWTPNYYQHLSFRNAASSIAEEQRRLELRGYRPQQTIQEYLLEIEFLDARLNYLNELNEEIEVKIPRSIKMSNEEKIKRFKKIVKESNLDMNRFQYFVDYDFSSEGRFVQSPDVETPTPSKEATLRYGVTRYTCEDFYKLRGAFD